MGAALSFLGQKLFASSTLISARCENISCCTSVAAVQPPVVRRTGGFLRKGMTTIYVDSRKRVAGSDSDFEVDLGESLHLQSDARLAVCKIRLADSFLSTDRGRYLYWVDAALGTLNCMCLRVTGPLRAMKCLSSKPVSTMVPTPLFSVILERTSSPRLPSTLLALASWAQRR